MYFLQSSQVKNYFKLEMTGTTIFNLSLNSIRKMRICLPLIEEQLKIVALIKKETETIITLTKKTKETV